MKVVNLSLNNGQVNLKNINLDFSNTGIYCIKGANGTGKTTLFNEIIFKNPNVEFNNEEYKKAYYNDRYNLISYVSQNSADNAIGNVLKYIIRHNKNVNIEDIKKYLKFFDLKEEVLKQKIERLSGGERMKCVIISAILKDTPYIFLDEPTNYVDNKTVGKIEQLLTEISKDRTVIIVTHDKRLVLEYDNVYEIENNAIRTLNEEKNTKINAKSLAKIKFKLGQIVEMIKINPTNVIFWYVCMFTILFTANNFKDCIIRDYMEGNNSIKNVIAVDNGLGSRVNEYLKETKVKKEVNDKDILKYSDVANVAKIKGVDKVLLLDNAYLEYKAQNENLSERIIAVPQEILNEKNYYNSIDGYISETECLNEDTLIVGRYPRNYANEICLSIQLAKQKFGENCTYNNLIDQYIEIKGHDYKIVGIAETKYSLVSFEDNKNLGIYTYDKNTYKEFLQYNNSNCEEYITCFIKTKDGMEKQVLDTLIKQFSGSDYRSNVYYQTIASYSNKMLFLKKIIPQLAIFGGLLGYIFLFLQKQVFKKEERKLNDLINYYLQESKIKWVYLRNEINSLIMVAFGTIIAYLLVQSKYYNIFDSSKERIWAFSLLTMALVVLQLAPTVCFTIRKYRKWKC